LRDQSGQGVLGIVSGMQAARANGQLYVHRSFGLLIDRLSQEYKAIVLSLPTGDPSARDAFDYAIQAENVVPLPQPNYQGMAASMRCLPSITRTYSELCSRVDHLLIRGMVPNIAGLYAYAVRNRLKPCHWIVGDPVALLKSHRRGNWPSRWLGLTYSYADRILARVGRRLSGGAFLCNGDALARVYASPRTLSVISSTLNEADFLERGDTCDGSVVRVLLLSFMRPEKGAQYLIEAVGQVRVKPCMLILAGPFGRYGNYKSELETLIVDLGLQNQVALDDRYIQHGEDSAACFRAADIFVLPSLSEGTPRILLEARAAGLPVIATRVGGIPSSVTDGHDGLLVAPGDPRAIAVALERLIVDGGLRRKLIRNGQLTARRSTLEAFSQRLLSVLKSA